MRFVTETLTYSALCPAHITADNSLGASCCLGPRPGLTHHWCCARARLLPDTPPLQLGAQQSMSTWTPRCLYHRLLPTHPPNIQKPPTCPLLPKFCDFRTL